MSSIEVSQNIDLEEIQMNEIRRQSTLSEQTPPLTSPLVMKLNFMSIFNNFSSQNKVHTIKYKYVVKVPLNSKEAIKFDEKMETTFDMMQ